LLPTEKLKGTLATDSAVAEVVTSAAAARTAGARMNLEKMDFMGKTSSPVKKRLVIGEKIVVKFSSRKRQMWQTLSLKFQERELGHSTL
jgi:hypothetical protein